MHTVTVSLELVDLIAFIKATPTQVYTPFIFATSRHGTIIIMNMLTRLSVTTGSRSSQSSPKGDWGQAWEFYKGMQCLNEQ